MITLRTSLKRRVVRRAALAFGLSLFLFTGCTGGEDDGEKAEPVSRASTAIVVDAEEAVLEKVEVSIDAVGSLEAAEDVLIAAELDGLIEEIAFEEGMPVTRGTVLVRFDDKLARLEATQAEKRLDRMKAGLKSREAELRSTEALAVNAKSIFARKKILLDQDATTEAVYMDAKAKNETAQAAVDQAEAVLEESKRAIVEADAGLAIALERLSKFTIHAPFDGTLSDRFKGPGDFVKKGNGLVRLVAVNPLTVNFTVPERYGAGLSQDQSVSLMVEAYPDRVFHGRVIYLAPDLDAVTRSVLVKARVDNEAGLLRPGFFCRVRLILDVKPEAVVIPEEAVIPRGASFFVYVVEKNKAVRKEIVPGQRMAGRLEIARGLAAGELVITAGQQRVSDGSPVRVRDGKPASARTGKEN